MVVMGDLRMVLNVTKSHVTMSGDLLARGKQYIWQG